MEVFGDSMVMTEPKHWRPFACPACVFDDVLQQKSIKNKWSNRSRVGPHLGRSPLHARSVALVLNLQTGRVSPQCHVQCDPSFQTKALVRRKQPSITVATSLWLHQTQVRDKTGGGGFRAGRELTGGRQ